MVTALVGTFLIRALSQYDHAGTPPFRHISDMSHLPDFCINTTSTYCQTHVVMSNSDHIMSIETRLSALIERWEAVQ